MGVTGVVTSTETRKEQVPGGGCVWHLPGLLSFSPETASRHVSHRELRVAWSCPRRRLSSPAPLPPRFPHHEGAQVLAGTQPGTTTHPLCWEEEGGSSQGSSQASSRGPGSPRPPLISQGPSSLQKGAAGPPPNPCRPPARCSREHPEAVCWGRTGQPPSPAQSDPVGQVRPRQPCLAS